MNKFIITEEERSKILDMYYSKRIINETTQCGNVVPMGKAKNNSTIVSNGHGGVIVNGKYLYYASGQDIIGEEVDIQDKSVRSLFSPGDYVLYECKKWGWLINTSNGEWNGYIIKSDKFSGIPTRCGFIIIEKDVSIDENFNFEGPLGNDGIPMGPSEYTIHKINYDKGQDISDLKSGDYGNKIISINEKTISSQSIPEKIINDNPPSVRVIGSKATFSDERTGTTYQVDFSKTLGNINIKNGEFTSWYVDKDYKKIVFKGLDPKPDSMWGGFFDKDTKTSYFVYIDTKGKVLKHIYQS